MSSRRALYQQQRLRKFYIFQANYKCDHQMHDHSAVQTEKVKGVESDRRHDIQDHDK